MKKIIVLLSLIFLIASPVYSQTPAVENETPSTSTVPADSSELEKIQKIKDIVASKVAELDLVEKRGLLGKIKERKNTSLTIEDNKGNLRNIDVDELTTFSIGNDDEAGVSDLEEEATYSFVGIYNKDTERLLARSVEDINTIPTIFEGAVVSINEDDFQIEVIDSGGKKMTVDILTSTKTNLITDDGELEKSGFSKILINERVLIVGFLDNEDDSLLSATRISHFETLPPSNEMKQFVSGSDTNTEETE